MYRLTKYVMLFHNLDPVVIKHNEILPSKPKVHLLLTVSYSRSEYFLRNDLLDPTSDDRHLVASSRLLMTSEEDRKHVKESGPPRLYS